MNTHIVQDNQGLSPATLSITDGMEEAAANNSREKLLNEESQEDTADGGQVEVVDEEQSLELVGLTVAHELATTEDDGVVDDDEDRGGLEGRHGGLERHKLEVVGRVAHDGGPCLVEDGPQVDAEGPVDGRQRELLVKGCGRGRHDGRSGG